VFYGKDVSALSSESWRKQWMRASDNSALRVNFLSPSYLRSQACASEWNHPKDPQLNVILGGSGVRDEILALPLKDMAPRGADAIKMFLNDGGQAISVYDADSGRQPSDVCATLLEHFGK